MSLHELPKTEVDIEEKRIALREQRDEISKYRLKVYVTCPCGLKVALRYAFRCYFCGMTFCPKCAGKHFGEKKYLMGHEYIEERKSK